MGATTDARQQALHRLQLWLKFSGWVYLGAGLVFLLAPDLLLGTINQVGAALAPGLPVLPLHPDAPDRFWLILSGSMMATIAASGLLAAADIERREVMALPIVVSKLCSSALGVLFFFGSKAHLAYLAVVLSDLPLGLCTLWLYRRSRATSVRSASL